MAGLLERGGTPGAGLAADCEELLAAGWRAGPGGTLLLARTDEFLARQRPVPPEDVGEYEYEHNDFSPMSEDPERGVPAFAPRLAGEGWLEDDDQVSYLGPDGQLLADW